MQVNVSVSVSRDLAQICNKSLKARPLAHILSKMAKKATAAEKAAKIREAKGKALKMSNAQTKQKLASLPMLHIYPWNPSYPLIAKLNQEAQNSLVETLLEKEKKKNSADVKRRAMKKAMKKAMKIAKKA